MRSGDDGSMRHGSLGRLDGRVPRTSSIDLGRFYSKSPRVEMIYRKQFVERAVVKPGVHVFHCRCVHDLCVVLEGQNVLLGAMLVLHGLIHVRCFSRLLNLPCPGASALIVERRATKVE